jgi:hypothetical protein
MPQITGPFSLRLSAVDPRDGELDLAVDRAGNADLFLSSSSSLRLCGLDRIGRFGGRLAPDVERDLRWAVRLAAGRLDGTEQPGAPDPHGPSRTLTIESDAGSLALPAGPDTADLESMLVLAAAGLATRPVRALEATLELGPAPGTPTGARTGAPAQLDWAIRLLGIGREPIDLLLLDLSDASTWLRLELEHHAPEATRPTSRAQVERDAIVAQVGAVSGRLGRFALPPGEEIRIDGPRVEAVPGSGTYTAMVTLWLPGPGRSVAIGSIRTLPVLAPGVDGGAPPPTLPGRGG